MRDRKAGASLSIRSQLLQESLLLLRKPRAPFPFNFGIEFSDIDIQGVALTKAVLARKIAIAALFFASINWWRLSEMFLQTLR